MHFLGLHPQLPLLSLWHRLGMREDVALSQQRYLLLSEELCQMRE